LCIYSLLSYLLEAIKYIAPDMSKTIFDGASQKTPFWVTSAKIVSAVVYDIPIDKQQSVRLIPIETIRIASVSS